MWRDDLAKIAALMGQLNNVHIEIEADKCGIDDIDKDLAEVGKRLSYIEIKALETDTVTPEVLRVRIAKDRSYIEAANPSPETRGIISDVEEEARRCRTFPLSLTRVVRSRTDSGGYFHGGLALLLGGGGAIWVTVAAVAVGQYAIHGYHRHVDIRWPGSLIQLVAASIVVILGVALWERGRTLLFTGTRSEAPTFWQRHKWDIAINLVVGGLFYLLGLLTSHL
jgi:hypothetical protein